MCRRERVGAPPRAEEQDRDAFLPSPGRMQGNKVSTSIGRAGLASQSTAGTARLIGPISRTHPGGIAAQRT